MSRPCPQVQKHQATEGSWLRVVVGVTESEVKSLATRGGQEGGRGTGAGRVPGLVTAALRRAARAAAKDTSSGEAVVKCTVGGSAELAAQEGVVPAVGRRAAHIFTQLLPKDRWGQWRDRRDGDVVVVVVSLWEEI